VLLTHLEHLALEGRLQGIRHQIGRPVVISLLLDQTTDVNLDPLRFSLKGCVLKSQSVLSLNRDMHRSTHLLLFRSQKEPKAVGHGRGEVLRSGRPQPLPLIVGKVVDPHLEQTPQGRRNRSLTGGRGTWNR
jgi:hypothetical protein